MKVVLDTNVLLAGLATRGLCEAIVTACLEAHEVVLSEHILREVDEHLRSKLGLSAALTREVDALLREHATIVNPAFVPADACRDADDLAVLGTAMAGGVQALVTGDAELLRIKIFAGIAILSPREFYERVR